MSLPTIEVNIVGRMKLLFGNVKGGASDFDFVNFDELDIDEPDSKPTIIKDLIVAEPRKGKSKLKTERAKLSLFQDDSMEEFRNKIAASIGVNPHLLFICWNIDSKKEVFRTSADLSQTYSFSINSEEYDIGRPDFYNIDEKTIDASETIKIIPYDTIQRITKRVYYVYIITDFINDEIKRQSTDSFFLSTAYNGFFVKYWPRLRIDHLKNLIAGDDIDMHVDLSYLKEQEKIIQQVYKTSISKSKYSIFYAVFEAKPNTRYKLLVNNIGELVDVNDRIIAIKWENYLKIYSGYRPKIYNRITRVMTTATERILPEFIDTNHAPPGKIIFYAIDPIIQAEGKLTLSSNGYFETSIEVPEDNAFGFNEMRKVASDMFDDLINRINKLGSAVFFPVLSKLPNLSDTKLKKVNSSVFWPVPMSSFEFDKMLTYIDSKLHASKIMQVTKSSIDCITCTTCTVKKGAIDYSESLFESSLVRSVYSDARNLYFYLWDVTGQITFDAIYPGRRILFNHRTSDVKLNIFNCDIQEFTFIRQLCIMLLKTFITGKKSDITERSNFRLRRLHEIDPKLYDLKAYNPDLRVYSVLCQSERQPIIYTKDELSSIDKKMQKRLFRYWNFTTGEPVYYLCSSEEYPNLSLRPGVHPLGFCLPCCKKISEPILRSCMPETFDKISDETVEEKVDSITKHIFIYGKILEAGRRSLLPKILKDMFIGMEIKGQYFIEGFLNSQEKSAIYYAVKYAITGEETIDKSIDEVLFSNGSITLTKKIIDKTVHETVETPTAVVEITDIGGNFSIKIDDLSVKLLSYSDSSTRLVIALKNDTGVYILTKSDGQKAFSSEDEIFTMFQAILKTEKTKPLGKIIDIPLLEQFVAANKKYKNVIILRHKKIYGAMIGNIYVPLPYIDYVKGFTTFKIEEKVRKISCTFQEVDTFIADINKFIKKLHRSGIWTYAELETTAVVYNPKIKKHTAIEINKELYFMFKPIVIKTTKPEIEFFYDFESVDNEIFKGPNYLLPDDLMERAIRACYNQNIYSIFSVNFMLSGNDPKKWVDVPKHKVMKDIDRIMKARVTLIDKPVNVLTEYAYIHEEGHTYIKRGKILVTKDRYDDLVETLAEEIVGYCEFQKIHPGAYFITNNHISDIWLDREDTVIAILPN